MARAIVPEPLQDLMRSRQSFYRRWAFHGDRVYQSMIVDLIALFEVTHFVETGTYLGDSSRFVSERHPQLPILTCEVDGTVCARARRRLRRHSQIEIVNDSSAVVVGRFVAQHRDRGRAMFFLDAHWYDYWPLADELKAISFAGGEAVIVIDDFEVQGRPDFAFDSYVPRDAAPGAAPVVCGVDYLEGALANANDYRILLPAYTYREAFPDRDDGALAGHVVVFQNLSEELDRVLAGNPAVAEQYDSETLTGRHA